MVLFETERLIIRNWEEADFKAFAKMNSDPRVMEYFPSVLNHAESRAFFDVMIQKNQKNGFCYWPIELKLTEECIGFVGLDVPGFKAHFTPCVEIGWHLAHQYWGKGYAPESAVACLDYGFNELGLQEVVSFTSVNNLNSRKLMEKIGMTHHPEEDFDHPKLEEGHYLRRHVLYRIKKG
jgi:RimJ/RimL family protein N-acetyltransferase